MFTSDTILDIYHSATNGIFAVLVGVVGAVARGRRHRHHEHHADGGHRADARDRPAQGARRAAVRHHGADAHRVGGAVDLRRRHRHDARRGDRADDLVVHADSGGGRGLVGRARHRHHGAGRPVLRPVSGDARGARSIRSKRCGGNRRAWRSASACSREVVVDGVRHRAHQQDALGADRARRGHRHHVDRRHDGDDPRLRPVAARHDRRDRPEHDLRPALRRHQLRQRRRVHASC